LSVVLDVATARGSAIANLLSFVGLNKLGFQLWFPCITAYIAISTPSVRKALYIGKDTATWT
jgi:hypothetical protein